jgi:antitoxin (DNA-binding transcriptional repressor) of toxin-antitoxin stability system
MTMVTEIAAAKLAELVKEVQAGNEVVLTDGGHAVARIVQATPTVTEKNGEDLVEKLNRISFKGVKVLTPNISQAEIAEEMYDRQ